MDQSAASLPNKRRCVLIAPKPDGMPPDDDGEVSYLQATASLPNKRRCVLISPKPDGMHPDDDGEVSYLKANKARLEAKVKALAEEVAYLKSTQTSHTIKALENQVSLLTTELEEQAKFFQTKTAKDDANLKKCKEDLRVEKEKSQLVENKCSEHVTAIRSERFRSKLVVKQIKDKMKQEMVNLQKKCLEHEIMKQEMVNLQKKCLEHEKMKQEMVNLQKKCLEHEKTLREQKSYHTNFVEQYKREMVKEWEKLKKQLKNLQVSTNKKCAALVAEKGKLSAELKRVNGKYTALLKTLKKLSGE